MSIEAQAGAPADFQQWADATLVEMYGYLQSVRDPDVVAPSASPPVYATYRPPQAPPAEAPLPPIPVVPGTRTEQPFMARVDRDLGGRRSRLPHTAGAVGELAAAAVRPAIPRQAAPAAPARVRRPAFPDMWPPGMGPTRSFSRDMAPGRRPRLHDIDHRWDPGK